MNEDRTPAPGVNAIDFYRDEIDRLRAELAAAHKFMDRDVEDYEALRAELKDCESSHKEMSGAYENASVEAERLRAEVHEANAACDAQIRECYHLRAENAVLRDMLISLRQELKGYEMAATGESYNNTELNALLAKTAKEGE